MLTFFSWLLTVLSVIGAIRNAQGKIDGFIIWLFSNVGWVGYTIYTKQPAQIALFSVYTAITIYGLYKWHKIKRQNV